MSSVRKLTPGTRTSIWIAILVIFAAAFFAANFDYPKYWNGSAEWLNGKQNIIAFPQFSEEYSLGLDLQGGVELVYKGVLEDIPEREKPEKMELLRSRIERRINALGVREPRVQLLEDKNRVIVGLAGIEDPDRAIKEIGETPFLQFKELRPEEEQVEILRSVTGPQGEPLIEEEQAQGFCQQPNQQLLELVRAQSAKDPCFKNTNLTGEFLEGASVTFQNQTNEPIISLRFNEEGAQLFEQVTERNTGKPLAIFLDDRLHQAPIVQQKIAGGQATITGFSDIERARTIARGLNDGALPVPIELIGQRRVSASLGEESLQSSLKAGIIALLAVVIFLIVVYRLSGLLSAFSLAVYIAFLVGIIKLIPITLTLAGIAGLILSIGMAVDANVLIFERLKEEVTEGKENLNLAIDRAFERAWPSIRDGNISTLLTAVILFWFATSFIKGFALVLGLGILVSLFSSMIVTRYLMKGISTGKLDKYKVIWTR